jgi:hypothetical protein
MALENMPLLPRHPSITDLMRDTTTVVGMQLGYAPFASYQSSPPRRETSSLRSSSIITSSQCSRPQSADRSIISPRYSGI